MPEVELGKSLNSGKFNSLFKQGSYAKGAMFREERKSGRIKRRGAAALVSLTGVPIIECILKDISATGARISVEVPDVVPDYFKLRIREDDEQLLPKCRVRWRSGNEIGVEFWRLQKNERGP